jgi:predicted permease
MEAGIARLPGVRGVALSENPLLSWSSSQYTITIPGYARPKNNPVAPYVNTVNSNFVATLGMRVLLGRDFTVADGRSSHRVALVNERMSKKYFAGRAVGRMFWFNDERPIEIIGVVSDAKYDRIRVDTPETVYVLYSQRPKQLFGMTFEVRTAVSPLAIVGAVRHVAAGIDPRIPIAEVRTQQAQMDQLLGRERTFAALAGFFGVISLLLASIGLYGLLAYAVNRRTNEIGVRVALGAGRGAVQWLVLRECVLLTALGIAAGVPVALAATKVIKSRLYGVESNDPGSVLIAVTAMTVVAMFAAWLPARRAARVDPIVALRYE